jgi:hypothetical protein
LPHPVGHRGPAPLARLDATWCVSCRGRTCGGFRRTSPSEHRASACQSGDPTSPYGARSYQVRFSEP